MSAPSQKSEASVHWQVIALITKRGEVRAQSALDVDLNQKWRAAFCQERFLRVPSLPESCSHAKTANWVRQGCSGEIKQVEEKDEVLPSVMSLQDERPREERAEGKRKSTIW